MERDLAEKDRVGWPKGLLVTLVYGAVIVWIVHFGMLMNVEKKRRAWCAAHGFEAQYRKGSGLGCYDRLTDRFTAFPSMYSSDMPVDTVPRK